MTSGKIKVKYHWQHQRHDPTEISDAVRSQLPSELHNWIKKHVENSLDWDKIQDYLRLTDEQLRKVCIVYIVYVFYIFE